MAIHKFSDFILTLVVINRDLYLISDIGQAVCVSHYYHLSATTKRMQHARQCQIQIVYVMDAVIIMFV